MDDDTSLVDDDMDMKLPDVSRFLFDSDEEDGLTLAIPASKEENSFSLEEIAELSRR